MRLVEENAKGRIPSHKGSVNFVVHKRQGTLLDFFFSLSLGVCRLESLKKKGSWQSFRLEIKLDSTSQNICLEPMLTQGLLCAQCTTSLGELFSSFCLTVSSCSPWSQLQTPEYTESFFPSGPLGVTFPWPRIPPFLFPKLVFPHSSHIPPLRDAFFTPQLEESPPPIPSSVLPKHTVFTL